MAIDRIDYELCVGCGICEKSCEADVIRMNEDVGKPYIAYQDDCVLCSRCELDCPTKAIHIGPDMYIPITTAWGK